ncbi:MAG: hypothetical protein EB012_09745 [Gammaproteobacteria bacterium]|nr:hypothetical protein [Gammaproteobacteria bacterium]NDE35121.1 hypothetical protein [Gammaproteobacteria bacterium]NDE57109.1 hypothetical protein [Gammaproteobacteria bacterium]
MNIANILTRCIGVLVLGFFSSSGIAVPLDGVSNMVKVWATVAPEEPLDGATVSVRDAKGRLVGRGRTNENGRENILLTTVDPSAFPLKIITTGGSAKNVKFHGHLTARTSQVGAEFASVKMDLLSSAASLLTNANRTYPQALSEVRQSLGIGIGAPDYVLQVKNIHVDKVRLNEKRKRLGGFGAVVNAVAKASRNGRRFKSLEPISDSDITQSIAQGDARQASPRISIAAVDGGIRLKPRASSATDVCSAPVGNGDESKSSEEIITDIGVAAMFALGKYAGVPSAATEPVLGMFLNFPDPTAETLQAIQAQLTCISTQIAYLSEQVAYLSVQVSLNVAQQCSTKMDTAWESYRDAIAGASTYPLNSSNASFIDVWLPNWKAVHDTCGSAINTALFSSNGGQTPAWPTLVKIYQDKHGGWLKQSEVQELQEFLAYWGEIENQQFTLRSEYDNYYGYYQDISSISGFNTADTNKCVSGTSSATSKFCVWANNIKSAYPGDLYSDELGVMSNGQGIMLYPWNTTPNLTYEMIQASIASRYNYGEIYGTAALEQQNSLKLNTSEENTAKETFSNPRVKRKYRTQSESATAFLNFQDDVIQIYLNRTNEDPNSPWIGKDAKDIAASVYESYSNYNSFGQTDCSPFCSLQPGLFLNNLDSQTIYCYPDYCSNSSTKRSSLIKIGVLLGRSWWPGSSKAATYTPPPPPT